MIIKKQEGKIVFEPRLFISRAKEDVLANGSILYSEVGGNAGANFGGLFAGVGGNAKLNASLGYSEVGESHDYTIGDIAQKITKYLPECVRKINLPALNFGVFTNTKDLYNSFALGIFNNNCDTGE